MHTSKQEQRRASVRTVFKNGSMTASLPGYRGAHLQGLPKKLHGVLRVAVRWAELKYLSSNKRHLVMPTT